MATFAAALHEHDLMLADPPGDDPTWPKCENCGIELEDDTTGVVYCSLDCAYNAGAKGERAMWRAHIAHLLDLADLVRHGAIQSHWADITRLHHRIEELHHD